MFLEFRGELLNTQFVKRIIPTEQRMDEYDDTVIGYSLILIQQDDKVIRWTFSLDEKHKYTNALDTIRRSVLSPNVINTNDYYPAVTEG